MRINARATRAAACALISAGLIAGCGSSSSSTAPSTAQLRSYVHEVEPIRLAVNRLLGTADPTLSAFHQRRITGAKAAARLGALERRFAAYAVDVNAIDPAVPALRALHQKYAYTYILEDAYLSALVSGVAARDFSGLPNTQAQQRAAIIEWRIGLDVLARRTKTALPPDLEQAGRGEIAPSPEGS
jgi:hypothetical protein